MPCPIRTFLFLLLLLLGGGWSGHGSLFRFGFYDADAEKLRNVSKACDVGPSAWAVAGQSEQDGSILHMGWVTGQSEGRMLGKLGSFSIMSAVRVLSFDRASRCLVTNPMPGYASLRTLVPLAASNTPLQLVPGAMYTPTLSPGEGAAVDIELSVAVPADRPRDHGSPDAGAIASVAPLRQVLSFELQVLAAAAGGSPNATTGFEDGAASVVINVSSVAADGARRGTATITLEAEGILLFT